MKTIASRQNPLFKRIRDAIREHRDEIVIEGPKPVADAIEAGWKPLALATRVGAADSPAGIVATRPAGEAPAAPAVVAFDDALFDQLAETRSPQSVIGLFARPRTDAHAILSQRDRIIVALDAVQDPGNVGTIIRLAAAFDAAGVLLLPGCADPFAPKTIRSTAGAILTVPVANISAEELIESSVPLFAADARGTRSDPPSHDAILVFGSEGTGVSSELMNVATPLAIAMSGRVESLNVASSAAILLSRAFAARTS
ncbi:MAG TPA: RNA methyltransferase [Thermoanaerobaculia bacterium]|nr:RNA methyltransferase [Thermoanaerobaculia bacterium]